ncbi:MAG: hypothetical protein CMC82_02825 [Flavobacteriaceae bacterium]|nr:hypothetical protein [Flavobacteriaceae bacterium]|tara:strand:- start:1867 stop:2868 length:1002 start_codon:yes stop_codon:yes gene_type:complete
MTMFSCNIKDIPKIKLNLFDLKPKEALESTYAFFDKELSKYFCDNGDPDTKFFSEIDCPLCGCPETTNIFSLDKFSYDKCTNCAAVYNKKMLRSEVLEGMYASGIYIEYFKKLVAGSQTIRKELLERRKVAQLSSFFDKPGTLLDVGCGSGSLLKECKDIGWKVFGIDPSKEACSVAKKKYGLSITQDTFENFETRAKFDCIVFIGIEHLQDPMNGIDKAKRLLKQNGLIFFEAPSADSFLMSHLTKYPQQITRFIEAGRHYLFFSKKSINYICEKYSLELEYLESNGLDLQTLVMDDLSDTSTNKLIDMQDTLNDLLLGDHYRVFLRSKDDH